MYKVINKLTNETYETIDYWTAIKIAGTLASNYYNEKVICKWQDENTLVIERENR